MAQAMVVHEALETIVVTGSYSLSLTPITNSRPCLAAVTITSAPALSASASVPFANPRASSTTPPSFIQGDSRVGHFQTW